MAFPDDYLHPNESLLLNLKPHWFRLVPAGAALLASIIFGAITFSGWDGFRILAGLLIVGTAIWFVASYISWVSTHFVLTSDRVIHREGVFRRSGIEFPLERINTVFSSQSMFERLIGAGDLSIESASESGRQNFEDMRNPREIQNEIYQAMEDNENRKFDRINRGAAPAPAPAAPSVTEQLAQLDELRQKGVLTQEEFDRKKAELLDRM